MNFLAHLYLANTNKEIIIGNFIADTIKGKQYQHLSTGIQFGIKMHRAIDVFTDEHPIFRKSKRRLSNTYRLYKGVIIDLIYDHFLAKNWQQYSAIPLINFSQGVYDLLYAHFNILPEKTKYLLPYMTNQNWLYNYRTIEGIGYIFYNMNRRTKGLSKMDKAVIDLQENYHHFEEDFSLFFKDLQTFSSQYLETYDRKNN